MRAARPVVLYVDDERANLVAFRAMLRDTYEVLIAEDAAEGRRLLAASDVLVVISDQRMPGQTGTEFLEVVATDYPDTVRIILTGYADIEAAISAVNRGRIFYYFRKPWSEPEVRMILRNAVLDVMRHRQLAESELKYRTLTETTRTGYLVCDAEGMVLDANDEYVRLTGQGERKDVVGRRVAEWTAAHDLERSARALGELGRTGFVRALELDHVHPDGRLTPVEIDASCLSTVEGPRIVSFVRDISERRRAEEALRVKEAAIASSIVGIAMAGLDGALSYVNEAFVTMWGYPDTGEVLRVPVVDFWRDPAEAAALVEALLTRGRWVGEMVARRKDGSFFDAQLSANLVTDAAGRPLCMMASFLDVTERKKAESDVRSLNETLERRVAERTAELEAANRDLEAFSYSVSHDLRAPLRAINGFSGILAEGLEGRLDGENQHALDVIRENTSRMGRLIDALLSLSRAGRGTFQKVPVDMDFLARSVADELAGSVESGSVDLRVARLPPAMGDATLLRQVFTNLISNALKYSSGRQPAVVEVGSRNEEGRTVYFVKDNGAGFDMLYVDKLFRPFQRLHGPDEFPGVGVGLALVQRVVARHGGSLGAEGRIGEGATFWFSV